MRYLASREEMQQIDAYSIEEIGIPGLVLMEKAALSMEEEIRDRFSLESSFLIVVERGNNGGDGLALARLLDARGYPVDVYEIGGVPRASESYRTQYKILQNLKMNILEKLPEKEYDVIIDAIFGVGLTREVKGIQREVIDELNRRNAFRIAVDVPSGVEAGTGQILGTAFRADLTISFGLEKIGLILYPGASYCGEVCVKDIGFPQSAVNYVGPSAFTFEKSDLSLIPERKAWSNKGTYGKVLMVSGSKNMAGAACLCAEAAYRSGSGLVRIFTCEENRIILQDRLPEAILTTYDGTADALSGLREAVKWATVIGFGPGLGTGTLTEEMLKLVLKEGDVPLVLDADALNVLAKMMREGRMQWSDLDQYKSGMILTPHLMEMSRLCGDSISSIRNSLIETAGKYASSKRIVVLKDAKTIVSDGSDKTYINTSGNHGMSVGGSGDVLTGIICGLLANGARLGVAARLGVFIHGLAGDDAADRIGHYAMLARDIIEGLSHIYP